jgi:hypothetical protein
MMQAVSRATCRSNSPSFRSRGSTDVGFTSVEAGAVSTLVTATRPQHRS